MSINCFVRTMIRRDLVQVLDIEEANNPNPWKEKDFVRFFCSGEKRQSQGLVAEFREQVVGFMLFQRLPTGVILTELSVRYDLQRRGIGETLLDTLLGECLSLGQDKLTAYILETNLQAQLFLRSQEFLAVKVHRNYYEDIPDDVYEMEIDLRKHSPLLSAAGLAGRSTFASENNR